MCFFFKQKTAYEMRISDWSSDVCFSDLGHRIGPFQLARIDKAREQAGGHCLAVGGDLEERVGVDLLSAARCQLTGGARVDDLAVFDDADRKPRQVVARDGIVERLVAGGFVERPGFHTLRGNRSDERRGGKESAR